MQINTLFDSGDRVRVKGSSHTGTVHGFTVFKDMGRALGILYLVDLDDADRNGFHEEDLESELAPVSDALDAAMEPVGPEGETP